MRSLSRASTTLASAARPKPPIPPAGRVRVGGTYGAQIVAPVGGAQADVEHVERVAGRERGAPGLGGFDFNVDADADRQRLEAAAAVALLERHAAELSAVVIEPLVQCAGRMTMTGTGFYRRLAAAARRLGIDVIADEIAVGFGRTGQAFASQWAGVTPDFLCLSKGLAGVLPLAAVLIRSGFEDAFTGAPARSFLHSHTFTANPITCAAALAGVGLLRELLPGLPARVAAMAARREAVAAACPAIVAQRQIGMICAFQVDPARAPADGRLGLRLREAALERGVLLRPLHDTIYWLPPLVIDDSHIDEFMDKLSAGAASFQPPEAA